MSRNAVNHALRSQHPKNSPAPAGDLSPSSVGDHLRAEAQADRLRLQQLHFLLGLCLKRDLGLSLSFPAAEHAGVGCVRREVLVAGESRVGALGGNFTYGCRVSDFSFFFL